MIQTAETWGDKARAVAYALLVHLACVVVMLIGLLWAQAQRPPVALIGQVIDVDLVGPAAAPKPRAAARKPAPPKPQPAKPPEPKPETPSEPQRTDAIERERITELAMQKAEEEKRAQEERHRQEQIDLTEERKHEAQERERLKQLEDIKRQREAAEKKRKLEEQRLAQLKDLEKTPKTKPVPDDVPEADQARTGMGGQATGLQAEYFAAIQNAVTQNWLRPDTAAPGLRCAIRIVQIPGGDVLTAEISTPCNADAQTRTSIEQAVRRAAPLPYKGYEKVFQRDLRFNFSYDG